MITLRLKERVELRPRWHAERLLRYGLEYTPLVLQKYERVVVLDIFRSGFLCMTRHGRVILGPELLDSIYRPPKIQQVH